MHISHTEVNQAFMIRKLVCTKTCDCNLFSCNQVFIRIVKSAFPRFAFVHDKQIISEAKYSHLQHQYVSLYVIYDTVLYRFTHLQTKLVTLPVNY